ncbi:hypothetical protein DFH09DRAFT_1342448 [Mycena vulgaris]|nr:hypothetical protein DFH09DRAFT_1342448 [Mycena vulgaris]
MPWPDALHVVCRRDQTVAFVIDRWLAIVLVAVLAHTLYGGAHIQSNAEVFYRASYPHPVIYGLGPPFKREDKMRLSWDDWSARWSLRVERDLRCRGTNAANSPPAEENPGGWGQPAWGDLDGGWGNPAGWPQAPADVDWGEGGWGSVGTSAGSAWGPLPNGG